MNAVKVNHYYNPGQANSGMYANSKDCCSLPAEDHVEFVDETQVVIELKRNLRSLKGNVFPKGTRFVARRGHYEAMKLISNAVWGTNVLGQFAELKRAEIEMVSKPDYHIVVDTYNTAIPQHYAKEV